MDYCELALKSATNSGMNFRHGAIVFRGHEVVSRGYNHVTKVNKIKGCSCHAEVDAVTRLENKLCRQGIKSKGEKVIF
jgi:deoxycytidylate deaminase